METFAMKTGKTNKMCTCSVNESLKLKHARSISNCILWAHACSLYLYHCNL